MRSLNRYYNKKALLWPKVIAVTLSATFFAPVWGAPAEVLEMPAPLPSDPPPKTRDLPVTDATTSTQTGALNYSYPIVVPPGRHGMQPQLALSYSSQAPVYGDIAQGWSLNLPMIRRDKSAGSMATNAFTSSLAGGKELVEICSDAQSSCSEDVPTDTEKVFRAQHDGSYARYQKLSSAQDAAWRVLTLDGVTHYFGEASRMINDANPLTSVRPPHLFPLTRSVGPFGNTVSYQWRVMSLPGDYATYSLRLDKIEYSTNPGAGLTEPFATVQMNWDAHAYCEASKFPIGATEEVIDPDTGVQFDEQVWYEGAQLLASIETQVRDAPGGSLRSVRRYDLEYGAGFGSGSNPYPCSEERGTYRSLLGVTEVGDPNGANISLPQTTFLYNPGERSAIWPKTATLPEPGWPLAKGTMNAGAGFAEVDHMLLDLDGDGRLDFIAAEKVGNDCQLRWYRNTSGKVGNATDIMFTVPQYYSLPTLPWRGLSSENCSLTGQLTFIDNIPGPPPNGCPPDFLGTYLVYRFMDMNADGLPDLVTAVHEDTSHYDHSLGNDLSDLYNGTAPTCSADGPYCANLDQQCVDDALVCTTINDKQYCELDQADAEACVASAPPEECDDLDLALLGLSPPGGPPACQARSGRDPFELDCGYLWNVYYNQGPNGSQSPFDLNNPSAFISPSELESYQSDGQLVSTQGGYGGGTWSHHAVQDFDGDGVLDIAHTLGATNSGKELWQLWRGQLIDNNGTTELSINRSSPITWQSPTPMGDSVVPGSRNWEALPGGPLQYLRTKSTVTLLDLDGNGLPDLLWGSDSDNTGLHGYRNRGNGFVLDSSRGFYNHSPLEIDVTSSSIAKDETAPYGPNIDEGTRFACIQPLDWDHDGRVDYVECRDSLSGVPDPRIAYSRGDSLGSPIEIPNIYLEPRPHGHYQNVDASATGPFGGSWDLRAGISDLDGDGLEEDIFLDDATIPIAGDLPGMMPRLLRSIDNGAGLVTTIDYAPHIDESVVEEGNGRSPRALAVVKSITRTDAHGADGTTAYSYKGPVFGKDDDHKSGFRGFAETRTKSPLGALQVSRFDYDIDWSGRMVESLVFEDEANYGGDETTSGTDEAHSISKMTWAAFGLFNGSVTTFHETQTRNYQCDDGQSIDDCESNGALVFIDRQITPIQSPYMTGGNENTDLAHAETLRFEQVGESLAVGDRRHPTLYTLYSYADKHLLREYDMKAQRISHPSGTSYGTFNRKRWLFNNFGRNPYIEFNYLVGSVWAVSYTKRDLTTGNTLWMVKPQQYKDHGTGGPKTTVAYDAFELYPTSTTDELGHVVTATYDIGTGNVLTREGPRESGGVKFKETFEYDGFGRLTSRKTTRDNSGTWQQDVEVEKVTYFDSSSPQMVRRESRIDFSLFPQRWTRVDERFDGHGRLLSTTTETGDPSRPDPVVSHTYDGGGNLIGTTVPDPSKDDSSTVAYSTTFDSLGRPIGFSTPATAHDDLTISYDGLVVHKKRFDGSNSAVEESILTSDEFGRLTQVEELATASNWATTQYDYDINNNMVQIVSADGVTTDLGNNWLGWRESITRGGRAWTYTYDRNGNMLTVVDPIPSGGSQSDYTTSMVYDDLDRVTSNMPGTRGMTTTELDELGIGTAYYTYDLTGVSAGLLTDVSHSSYALSYAHDARGNVTSETIDFDVPTSTGVVAESRTNTTVFNAAGAPSQTVLADGTTINIEYDDATRPIELLHGSTSVATLERNVAGLPVDRQTPSVLLERVRNYDVLGRTVQDQVNDTVVGKVVLKQNFTYDGGLYRVTQLDHYVGPAVANPNQDTYSFSYDPQDQIVAASGAGYLGDFEYTVGGRLSRANVTAPAGAPTSFTRDVTYDYSGASDPEAVDALVNFGTQVVFASYAYDASGNTTSRSEPSGTWTFVFDGEDQQRKATAPDGTSEIYEYDASGTRFLAVERDSLGNPIRTRFWRGGVEIWFDSSGQADTTLAHASLDGPAIRIKDGTNVQQTFHDDRGHLLLSVGASDSAYFTYGPFGEVLAEGGNNPSSFLRRFNGKDIDEVSALSYYGYRYYDSLTLMWTQGDPLFRFAPEGAFDKPRGANLYVFSLNNPNSFVDTDGLEPRIIKVGDVNLNKAQQSDLDKTMRSLNRSITGNDEPTRSSLVPIRLAGKQNFGGEDLVVFVIASNITQKEFAQVLRNAGKSPAEAKKLAAKHLPSMKAGKSGGFASLGKNLAVIFEGAQDLGLAAEHETAHALGLEQGTIREATPTSPKIEATKDNHHPDPNNLLAEQPKSSSKLSPRQIRLMKKAYKARVKRDNKRKEAERKRKEKKKIELTDDLAD